MNEEEIKNKIKQFIGNNNLCVLSTVDEKNNSPESALVGYVEDDLKITFGTSVKSRKYQNLKENTKVAIVIGWSSTTGTIQYEGFARELKVEEYEEYSNKQYEKNPLNEKQIIKDDHRYFIVTPTWIRFIDTAGSQTGTYEITLDN